MLCYAMSLLPVPYVSPFAECHYCRFDIFSVIYVTLKCKVLLCSSLLHILYEHLSFPLYKCWTYSVQIISSTCSSNSRVLHNFYFTFFNFLSHFDFNLNYQQNEAFLPFRCFSGYFGCYLLHCRG